MSLQTTEAAALARAAEKDWRAHERMCASCKWAKQIRRPAQRCQPGAELALSAHRAREEHKRQKAADAKPAPGQRTLW